VYEGMGLAHLRALDGLILDGTFPCAFLGVSLDTKKHGSMMRQASLSCQQLYAIYYAMN
jgi:hypothetical protein